MIDKTNLRKIAVNFDSLFDVHSLWHSFHKKKYKEHPLQEYDFFEDFEIGETYSKESLKRLNGFLNGKRYSELMPHDYSLEGIDKLLEHGIDLSLIVSDFNQVPQKTNYLIEKHFSGRFDGKTYFTNNYRQYPFDHEEDCDVKNFPERDIRQTFICLDKNISLLIDDDFERVKDFARSGNQSLLFNAPRNQDKIITDRWEKYLTRVDSWDEIVEKLI